MYVSHCIVLQNYSINQDIDADKARIQDIYITTKVIHVSFYSHQYIFQHVNSVHIVVVSQLSIYLFFCTIISDTIILILMSLNSLLAYRNKITFQIFNLCPANFLNSLSRRFLVKSLGFSMQTTCQLKIRTVFCLSFQYIWHLFPLLMLLHWPRISAQC